jgi:hypothetical protein
MAPQFENHFLMIIFHTTRLFVSYARLGNEQERITQMRFTQQ